MSADLACAAEFGDDLQGWDAYPFAGRVALNAVVAPHAGMAWGPELYQHLARVLGFETPAGIVQ